MSETGRRHRKKEATRQQIMHAAAQLFDSLGFGDTTMEQVAETADVAKATLYNYFSSKDAIVAAQLDEGLQRFHLQLEQIMQAIPSTRQRLLGLLGTTVDWLEEHRDLLGAYFRHRFHRLAHSDLEAGGPSGFTQALARIIAAGQERGELRTDLDATTLAVHLEAVYTSAVIQWYLNPDCYPLRQGMHTTVELFINGAGKEDSP